MIVVDTNIQIYHVIPGQHTAEVETLLQTDPEWAVPMLWRSEFMNALFGLIRAYNIDGDIATAAWTTACLRVEGHEYNTASSEMLSFATSTRLTAYDAGFVLLAQTLGVPLLTYDRQLLRECPGTAVSPETFCA